MHRPSIHQTMFKSKRTTYLHNCAAAINPNAITRFFFSSFRPSECNTCPRITRAVLPSLLTPSFAYIMKSTNQVLHQSIPQICAATRVARPDHPSFVYADARIAALCQRIERHPAPVGAKRRLTYSVLPLPRRSMGRRDGRWKCSAWGWGPALAHSHACPTLACQ